MGRPPPEGARVAYALLAPQSHAIRPARLPKGFTLRGATAKRMEADRLSVELDIAANKPMRPPGVDRKGTAQQADGPGLRAAADEDDRSDWMGLQIRAPVGRERPPCGRRLDTDGGALAV